MGVVAVLSLAVSACGVDRGSRAANPEDRNGDFAGVAVSAMPLLSAGCTFTATATPTMTVVVKDGETAFVSLNPVDQKVYVNGNVFTPPVAPSTTPVDSQAPCQVPAIGATINIVTDTRNVIPMLGRSVVLDYIGGLYLKAATANTPGITIDFTVTGDNGAKNSLKIRGSDFADNFAVGAGAGDVLALNVNALIPPATSPQVNGTGGASVALDALADVTFKSVPSVIISAGAGDDHLDAQGVAGVGSAFPVANGVVPTGVRFFGNDGNDTITGGLGDDWLVGGLGADTIAGCQGNDTYDMGAGPAGADIIAMSCTATEGSDTLDYSKRKGNLSINLSRTPAGDSGATSGEIDEAAHISDKIVNINLGSGDDTITIPMGSTVGHRIKGGRGDDRFTGSGAADTFDGEAGDDTCIGATSLMDYSARTAPLTVSVCATNCATDNNDGDPSATGSTHIGTGAGTVLAGGIRVSTLTGGNGFTAASVGNSITLSSCVTTTDNGSFTIVRFVNAASVKIDTTGVSGFAASLCAFSEARPDGTTAVGSAATLAAVVTSASVTGLDHTANLFGHSLTLTSTSAVVTGNGTYPVLKSMSPTSVAIDASGVSGYAGGVTAMNWVELGAEHDNVQCASVIGGAGDDVLTGDARANVLWGRAGVDTLNGLDGNDTLFGEVGSDHLYGGGGADTLIGGADSDYLFGGDNNDILEGDAANDQFICNGRNSSTAASSGTVPGDSDFKVDFVAIVDLAGSHATCDY